MLAYVFWHRPGGGVDAAAYESALADFHRRLGEEALEGFHGSGSFSVDRLPWLPGGRAYEDWYLLEGSFALDILNTAAVTGAMTEVHGDVAALTAAMAAGLYDLVEGEGWSGARASWLSERPGKVSSGAALWRRQMVLGPTPQFCLLADAPQGTLSIERRRLV